MVTTAAAGPAPLELGRMGKRAHSSQSVSPDFWMASLASGETKLLELASCPIWKAAWQDLRGFGIPLALLGSLEINRCHLRPPPEGESQMTPPEL